MGTSSAIELTYERPQFTVPVQALREGPFYVRSYWGACNSDLDQVVGHRGHNSICGVVTSQKGREGSLDGYPFMLQLNDDRAGGEGEAVQGDLAQVCQYIGTICVGVYNNNPRVPLSEIPGLVTVLYLPGQPEIQVRPRGIHSAGCTTMRIEIVRYGIQVFHDVLAVDTRAYETPLESLTAVWNDVFWGRSK